MITFKDIEQALNLQDFDGQTAQMGMAPTGRSLIKADPDNPPRQSAVLVLIYPEMGEGLHLILTKRTDHLNGHSGQVSFPGGSVDEDDASYIDTALREACEEVGICSQTQVKIIGRLTTMWIPPSNFDVHPIVAMMTREPKITPNPDEVAAVLHMPLSALLDDATKKKTKMALRDFNLDVPYYDVGGHIVWGATAGMLSELELRLKQVLMQKESES
jgi:8-oxo-dGTP pyrophosphatase MutT (NUDIX family)